MSFPKYIYINACPYPKKSGFLSGALFIIVCRLHIRSEMKKKSIIICKFGTRFYKSLQ